MIWGTSVLELVLLLEAVDPEHHLLDLVRLLAEDLEVGAVDAHDDGLAEPVSTSRMRSFR